jgi:hypothetical protein
MAGGNAGGKKVPGSAWERVSTPLAEAGAGLAQCTRQTHAARPTGRPHATCHSRAHPVSQSVSAWNAAPLNGTDSPHTAHRNPS